MRKNLDTVEEFWSWDTIIEAHQNANEQSFDKFSRAFATFLGAPESTVHLTHSGKSALEALLSARKDMRSVVMVPALNCGRVQAAIEGAGCVVKTYDFHPEPGIFDWDLVADTITPQVGVIIVTHYYGVPVDLRGIRDFCNEKDILLIEDCAHTLGGYIEGQQVGTWGDAAIFSFNYDKPISLGWGGIALITSLDKFNFEENCIDRFLLPDRAREIELLGEFIKAMEIRRSLIPFGKNNILSVLRRFFNKRTQTLFHNHLNPFGTIQAELGSMCLKLYPEIRSIRNINAERFSSLCPLPTWPVMNGNVEPAWLKQKVFIPNQKQLTMISKSLQKKGIRAGNFNWPKLIGDEGGRACPNANQVASCWIDVPVHQKVEIREIEYMVSVLNKYV